jgi:hypothetical protein
MSPELVQHFFDSALRSQFGWQQKAALLFEAGRRTLETAAAAQPKILALGAGGSRDLEKHEIDCLNDYNLHEVGFFLMALTVETLLKALWAGRHYTDIKDVENMRKSLPEMTTHDLAVLARNAGFISTAEDETIFDCLRDYILWQGRYPVPLKVSDYGASFQSGPASRVFRVGEELDLPIPLKLNDLIDRLVQELKTIPKKHTA